MVHAESQDPRGVSGGGELADGEEATREGLVELTVGQGRLSGRTGRGVRVAVIDSGVNPSHPHIGGIAGTVAITPEGRIDHDALDRLGHGTAVAAAIHEKAPAAELLIVKVFHETLSTSLEGLLTAIDTAAERGAGLINLSLGTANPQSASELAEAVERAALRGTIVVSAMAHGERIWFPGSLASVLGVRAAPEQARASVGFAGSGPLTAIASPYARPIPGVPPERNLNGVSFAVGNTTGVLACLLEGTPGARMLPALAEAIRHPE